MQGKIAFLHVLNYFCFIFFSKMHTSPGPTVLIFHTDCGVLFGACVDMEWKETESARGRDNCHLFAIQPQFHFEHNGMWAMKLSI